jgi:hypothetical protein
MNSRRNFIVSSISAASLLGLSIKSFAGSDNVSEGDSFAQALGYKSDASKVDRSKYAKYVAGQACVNCSYFQGKSTDTWAPCPMFSGKLVDAKGWCITYLKKT